MAGLVDAAINAAAQMLDEGAKQAPVYSPNCEISVDQDLGLPHRAAFLSSFFKMGCDRAPALAT